ncbi:MAG: hypothetical protein AB1349_11515 [Elusimicrobiota bacterium]
MYGLPTNPHDYYQESIVDENNEERKYSYSEDISWSDDKTLFTTTLCIGMDEDTQQGMVIIVVKSIEIRDLLK